jgi:tetratricopeptide (TPR) repeat protein
MRDAWFEARIGNLGNLAACFIRTSTRFIVILVFALSAWTSCQGQLGGSASMPTPIRLSTIYVQVALPNGRPAGGALVTLTPNSGTPRKEFTNDSGRLEFPGMPDGQYTLTATSPSDPNLISDLVEMNPSRTANGNLTVQLLLRDRADHTKGPKPGVIRAGEDEQRIPREARKAFNEGLKFKGNDEPLKAFESFNRAVELYREYYQAFSERGDVNVSQRKLEEAEADFDRALKINAYYGPALRGLGYCKLEKKEFAEAIELFEKSISADPNNANTHLLMGIANLELDRREPAREALQKALSFDTQPVPRAHIYLANLYAREHKYLQAADELHKYIEADPLAADVVEMREIESKWRARAAVP